MTQEGEPQEPEARAGWPWWKAKKWVLHITYRLFSRYGDPKTSRSGADGDFIMLFSQQCSLKFLEAHMKLMASYSQVGTTCTAVSGLTCSSPTACIGTQLPFLYSLCSATAALHPQPVLGHSCPFPTGCFRNLHLHAR